MAEAAGLYYETHGDPAAPPLILSSGLGGSASYWKGNLEIFARFYRVLIYDHRGTGRSDRSLADRVTVDDFADDIILLMDALGWDRTHLLGHAAGGVAGLALALKAPERLDRLVVVNGWARPDPHFLRCFEARLNLLRHSGIEAFLRAQPIFLYPANMISEHSAELDGELPQQIADFPGVANMEKRIAALASFDISDRLEDIGTSILLYATEDDMLVPSRNSTRMMDHLPNAACAMRFWGGHACNVTDSYEFFRFVMPWLANEPLPEE